MARHWRMVYNMTRIEILTQQAKSYDDDMLLEAMSVAADDDEIRVLDLEMEARTSPYFKEDSSRSLLGDLLSGTRLFS